MKRFCILILLMAAFCGCDVLMSLSNNSTLASMSQTELGKAVKELLDESSDKALAKVGITNGYFKNSEIKIPFPQELKKVEEALKKVGFTNQINQFTEKLNRSAEDAAAGVKEIFKSAISQMTINDAMSIISGGDDAATQYFKRTTTSLLNAKVSSVVAKSNEKIKLASYWTPLATKYNTLMSLTGGAQVNTDLTQYVTEKAVAGIFVMMAKEEKVIRTNASAQTSALLQKVFGSSSKGSSETKSGGSSTTSGAKPAKASGSTSGGTTSGSGTVVKGGK